jgi:hypothetical protein
MLTVIFIGCSLNIADTAFDVGADSWPCSARERVWLKPFAAAAEYPWTLFDLRELRSQLLGTDLDWELREIISGYDAVVLIKNGHVAQFAK